MFVTNFDFDDNSRVGDLTRFVDKTLKFSKASQVKLFRLHFSVIWARKTSVSNWIDKEVRLNVSELDIRVILIELPLSLFTCKTLTKLKLHGSAYDYSVWVVPCSVSLPCLKTLDIAIFSNPFVNAFKIIHGCPMLESLSLKVTWRNDQEDYIFNIPTLKRPEITWLKCLSVINKFVLNVPNLEYLFVGGILCSSFVVEDLSSLVEACISCHEIRFFHLWFELLKGINGVKSLSTRNVFPVDDIKIPFTSPLPIFPNLKHLELKGLWHSGLIPQFLENCPELKHLFIEKEQNPKESCWIEPKLVPTCMLTNLTTIKLSIYKTQTCYIRFLEYIFGNAKVLKMLTITCESLSIEEEMWLRVELVKLPKVSNFWSHLAIS